MKKKLVCILLCAVMLISCLMSTGCSKAGTETADGTDTSGTEDTGSRSSMTLSLWVPTDENTTEEALYLVEEAINRVTQSEFDTAIKLYAIPDSEYDAVMKERLETIETRKEKEEQDALNKRQEQIDAAQKGESYVEGTTEYVNPNMDGDYSLVVRGASGYTNIERNQLDIFLIRGAEDYKYYSENFYIESLNEQLTGNAKVLKNFIYPSFFTAAEVDGEIYGIPNNHAVGEYTYFLVNKDIVEKEYLDPEKLTNLEECKDFIEDVAEYYPKVTPLYGEYSPSYYEYWNGSGDTSKFSVLASRVVYNTAIENVTFDNIFSLSNFTSNYQLYKELKEKGLVSTAKNVPEKFGCGYITCTAEEIAEYADDYHINVFKRPKGEREDYLQNIFAVSTYTKDLSRSMEIITLLNTDTAFRTILQYGAEGTHWKYDEENPDIIVKLDAEKDGLAYTMKLEETGNVYMTYPDYGVSLDQWQVAKDQNIESYIPATYTFTEYLNDDNKALFAELDKLSAKILKEMESCSAEDFRSRVTKWESDVRNNEAFQKLTYIPSDSDELKGKTEEKGWIPGASLANQWLQYCISIYGEEFLTW